VVGLRWLQSGKSWGSGGKAPRGFCYGGPRAAIGISELMRGPREGAPPGAPPQAAARAAPNPGSQRDHRDHKDHSDARDTQSQGAGRWGRPGAPAGLAAFRPWGPCGPWGPFLPDIHSDLPRGRLRPTCRAPVEIPPLPG